MVLWSIPHRTNIRGTKYGSFINKSVSKGTEMNTSWFIHFINHSATLWYSNGILPEWVEHQPTKQYINGLIPSDIRFYTLLGLKKNLSEDFYLDKCRSKIIVQNISSKNSIQGILLFGSNLNRIGSPCMTSQRTTYWFHMAPVGLRV